MKIFLLFYFPFYILSQKIIPIFRKPINMNYGAFPNFGDYRPFYSEISVGNPSQNLKLNVNLQTYSYYFMSSRSSELKENEDLSSFDLDNSTSVETDEYIEEYLDVGITIAAFCYDYISIGNFPQINLPFVLVMELGYGHKLKSNAGILGFAPDKATSLPYYPISFLSETRAKGIIESKTFFFKFSENDPNKGEIIVGVLPEYYDNITYDVNYFKDVDIEREATDLIWGIQVNSLYYGNEDLNIGLYFKIAFDLDDWMITGPLDFNSTIYEKFFMSLINQQKCEVYSTKDYSFYTCSKDTDISGFKPIYLYNEKLDYNFTFTSKELFFNYNNKIVFAVKFPRQYMGYRKWSFGSIFLSKYKVLFDQENKKLGFYLNTESNDDPIIEPKTNLNFYILCFIFIVSLFVLAAALWYVYKTKKIKRKRRAMEIEDDFFYELKENPKDKIEDKTKEEIKK